MDISIFGLGYVGAVSAACLARDGHRVTGIDPNPDKLRLINEGQCPIVEAGLPELIATAAKDGRLRATADVAAAIHATEISLVCVGTPSQSNGNLDLTAVRKVCAEIGAALREKSRFHVIVMRSTMLPGTMRGVVIPTLQEHSGKVAGRDFGVCNNPEFLREGTAVFDYDHPPKTVIGESDAQAGDRLMQLYADLPGPKIRTTLETAEMVKYTDNAWHALKVAFANEIGNLCKATDIDGHRVMEIFCQDTKLNIAPSYLKPGFAFGGSCLPKDVRALTYKARSLDLQLPVLEAVLPSNRLQIDKGLKMITASGRRKVGILGFAFKAGTDDLRESPLVTVIEQLIGKGYDLRLYDRSVQLAALTGANREYILHQIPHISRLMVDSIDEVLAHSELVVIGNGAAEFRSLSLRPEQQLIDLVRIDAARTSGPGYEGICW